MKLAQSMCEGHATAKDWLSKAKSKEWREIVERKDDRGRLWIFLEVNAWKMGVVHPQESMGKEDSADGAQERQAGIQGQVAQKSPFIEVLEQVKRNADTDCNAQ